MADPTPNILSLAGASRRYSVFEPDQVLTYDQLNSLTDYLNDQGRLTRVELLGVGIVGGLQVARANGKIRVRKGAGITTDGDLPMLPADAVFGSFKPYGASAPRYAPFYVGATMRTLYELVRDGEVDASARSLALFPGNLSEMVVVMLMESHQDDPDLCSGTNCDNLGKTVTDTPRLLLVSRTDAATLLAVPGTASSAALALPELTAMRPRLGKTLATTGALAERYRAACLAIHDTLTAQLGTLHATLPALTGELFGGDPAPAWNARLNEYRSNYSGDIGIQYYYDFLKDVVEAWNELREALLVDDSLLCPDIGAFPKHLLLGDLTDPARFRTGLYPSPLLSGARAGRGYVRFLARRLAALVDLFAPPATSADPPIGITPSRGESAPMEDRALPYYYSPGIEQAWNYRLARRGAAASTPGYRAHDAGVFGRQIGRYDFFRIEGHLGQDLDAVMNRLEAEIADSNLPFAVRALLLHNDPTRLRRRPTIRYNDLHRMHKLVRTELDSELVRADVFSTEYRQRIHSAASNGQIASDSAKLSKADNYHASIADAIGESRNAFAKRRYSEFKADATWVAPREVAVKTAGTFKQEFGDVSRTDYVTAFDTAIVSNHKNWLDWLEVLIDDKDRKADERLLFANFIQDHPGLEHFGGVSRGGTFILVYDDSAKVVADFMLPYRCVEEVEREADEPTLSYIPPPSIKEGFVMIKPLDLQFEALKGGIRQEWTQEVDIQKGYVKFFQENLDIFDRIKGAKDGAAAIDDRVAGIDDSVARYYAGNIAEASKRHEAVKDILLDPATPDATRAAMQKELDAIEGEIAQAVNVAAHYVAEANMDMVKGGSGDTVMKIVSQGAGQVTNPDAKARMGKGLANAQDRAPQAAQQQAIARIVQTYKLGG